MNTVIESVIDGYAVAPAHRWWRFTYNGKPRIALVPDRADHNGNLLCLTDEGLKSFKASKMFGIEDVTVVN